MTETTERTMLDRIGGYAAVEAFTEAFYARVLNDPELRPYFEPVLRRERLAADVGLRPLGKLKRTFAATIRILLGDPGQLPDFRRHPKVEADHYWKTIYHVNAVLYALDVPEDVHDHINSHARRLAPTIIKPRAPLAP